MLFFDLIDSIRIEEDRIRMRRHMGLLVGVVLCVGVWAGDGVKDVAPQAVGIRYGLWANSMNDPFVETDVLARWDLPLRVELGQGWWMGGEMELGLGWLHGQGEDGVVAQVGPVMHLGREGIPVRLEGGTSPTYLTRHQFPKEDFGSHAQFTSRLGVVYAAGRSWSFGYSWSHTSNAGLGAPNPGLNMHMVVVMCRF
jgi:hypothetical protein